MMSVLLLLVRPRKAHCCSRYITLSLPFLEQSAECLGESFNLAIAALQQQ